jgi:hypothetical protein
MAYHGDPERRGRSSRHKLPGWLIGTIVTFGVIVLVVVGLFAGSFFFLRDAIGSFERADSSMDAVAEQLGPIAEFRPDPSGLIPAERLELFLSAREDVSLARDQLEQSLAALSGEDEAGAVRKTVAGIRLLHRTADYITRRNETLLVSSMSFGEYYYLYTLAYYSWLGQSPMDGPSFRLVNEHGYVLDEVLQGTPEDEVRANRAELVRTSLNRLLLPSLRNQLADLGPGDERVEAWRQRLQAEIVALESDARRIPWQDGVPEQIASSLRVYRDRIEQGYSPMCNALEVGLARR